MNTITKWTRNHSLFAYFILAYFFSWIIAIPLALQARGVIQTQITRSLHYLIAYGPMLAALMVTGLTSGTIGLQKLWSRMTKWRIKPGWWLVAVSPLGIYLLAGTALWALQGQKKNLATMGQIDYLPGCHPPMDSDLWHRRRNRLARLCPPPVTKGTQCPLCHPLAMDILGALAPAPVFLYLRSGHYPRHVDRPPGWRDHFYLVV
jgi:hypothetical protein